MFGERRRIASCRKLQRADIFKTQRMLALRAPSIPCRPDVEQFVDALFQPGQIQRLGEEIHGVHRHRAPGHVAGERDHEDDRDLFGGGLAAENFADGNAVEVGQQDVQQDEAGFHRPRLAQGVDAVIGHDQVIAVPREFVLQQLDEIILVIHNQDTRAHADKIACPATNAKTAG